ncbi:MAG TPA: small basic family protein [Chloroflexota bacterium]|nr:small basic family protein [Chloroflexota bacterium]
MWLPVLGLLIGITLGMLFSWSIPASLARYTAIGILATLDSILGAARAELEGYYDNQVFLTGLVTNTLLAALLTYTGDRLGVPLSDAAIVAFGIRIFTNLARIRRWLLIRWRKVNPAAVQDGT